MELLGMQLYKKRSPISLKVRARKTLELGLKSLVLLVMPLLPTLAITAFWHYVIYDEGYYFDEHMENIVTAAWIPTFGLLYCLLVAVVFNTVWAEYKTLRTAIKRYDIETFVDLRDEDISPLINTLVGICSLSILAGFMSLKYHDARWGAIIVGGTAYLLWLVFFVVRELDDPCGGIWFIKNIHPEWLTIDVHKWRDQRCKHPRDEAKQLIAEFTLVEIKVEAPKE